MANLAQMQAELQLQVMAKLLNADVTTLLNAAQRDEVESGWPWGFLLSNTILYPAAPQSGGTINVVQGSAAVTGNGTNFFLPPNAQSWLHIGFSQTPVTILSVQDATDLTLTVPWGGPSLTATSYDIITPVYSIVGFQEVYNVRQTTDLVKVSRESVNIADPSRLSAGGNPSTEWCDAGFDANNNPQIELRLSPSIVVPYVVEGKLAAATMVNPTDLPQIPSAVIINKCLMKCCVSLYAANKEGAYLDLANKYEGWYHAELDKAQAADGRRQTQIKSERPLAQYGLDVFAIHDLDEFR